MQSLYILTDPATRLRTLILATEEWALSIRPAQARASTPRVIIALIRRGGQDDPVLEVGVRKVGRAYGTLGLLNVGSDIFLAIVDSSSIVGAPNRLGENISRINAVSFHCLTTHVYDDHSATTSSTLDETYEHIEMGSTVAPTAVLEHPCASIRKILTNGQFYLASEWDLSSRLEARLRRPSDTEAGPVYDDRFLWNSFAIDPLLGFRDALTTSSERAGFDAARFVVLVIQGYVGVSEISLGGGARGSLSVISRLGWKRAGTRFLTRGVDDEGEVANFAETETILRTQDRCMSYVQVRGSIPLFWEQQAAGPFQVKLQITRPPVASQPAFNKHFEHLLDSYPRIHALSLLGARDHEAALSAAYDRHLRTYTASATAEDRADLSHFDFHATAKAAGIENMRESLRGDRRIRTALESFGFCLASINADGDMKLVSPQEGVFRVNCLDWSVNRSAHRSLWAENGDALSRIYAGTGALNTSVTRSGKQTLGGILSNAAKSAGRMYAAQVTDKSKQQAIDGLLGNLSGQQPVTVFDPVHDKLNEVLAQRASEYSSYSTVTCLAATWNLNGRSPGSESLLPWLFPDPGTCFGKVALTYAAIEPDILVIGFQELVELTANNVLLATDPEKLCVTAPCFAYAARRAWETQILRNVRERRGAKSEYVVLRTGQLVGTALIVLVKVDAVPHIRRVEGAQKKTGLKGVAGNKGASTHLDQLTHTGAVAIRLEYDDSSFCFVSAHLAAGHSNVDERISDWKTIASELRFQRGRGIDQHDNVVWLGDLNFRVTLANEDVRQLVEAGSLDPLLEADQLETARKAGLLFQGYDEAPITFAPTYKYDNGTDRYDSSEKQRIPAWTDRILYRGADLDLNRYARAELKNSDHRPVMALMRARVKTIDQTRKEALSAQLLGTITVDTASLVKPQAPVSTPSLPARANGKAKTALPPPSDEKQAWWNNGKSPTEPPLIDLDDAALSAPGPSNPFVKRAPPPKPQPRSVPAPVRSPSLPPPALPPRQSTSPPVGYAVRRKPPPMTNGKPAIPPRPNLSSRGSNGSLSVISLDSSTASGISTPETLIEAPASPEPEQLDADSIALKPSDLKRRGGDASWIRTS